MPQTGTAVGQIAENKAGGSVVNLNLSEPAAYKESVDWARENVVLKQTKQSKAVIQLEVGLPNEVRVTLFMDASNHYIMAFRGADKIYILDDDRSTEFESRLRESKLVASDTEATILKGSRPLTKHWERLQDDPRAEFRQRCLVSCPKSK